MRNQRFSSAFLPPNRSSPNLAAAYIIASLTVSALSTNPILTALCTASLAFVWIGALTTPFRTIIAAYLSYQWLQVSMKVWLGNILGVDLDVQQALIFCITCRPAIFEVTPSTPLAVMLGLCAVCMVSFGTRLVEPQVHTFSPRSEGLSASRLFIGYFVLLLVDRSAGPFIGGGLAQFIIALGSFKFVFALLIAFLWITRREGGVILIAIVTTELVTGFTGYFSGFKDIFIILGVGTLIVADKYLLRVRALMICAVAFLLVLGAIWTAIKPYYRMALSGGESAQVVKLEFDQRLSLLQSMISDLQLKQIYDGFNGMAARISYVDIFGQVMDRVPAQVPYQNGSVWADAIKNIIMPRILFPDKGVLTGDSVRTNMYTGRRYATENEGTSISIGYVGDSYIDFGVLGIFLIPMFLGLLYAGIARHIITLGEKNDLTITMAVLTVVLKPAMQFEMSSTKLLPGQLILWIAGFSFIYAWPAIRHYFSVPFSTPEMKLH